MTSARLRRWAGVLVPALLSACTDDSRRFGEACGAGDPCASGLFCAQATDAQGTCTMACDLPDPCPTRFGSRAFCHVERVCVMDCEGAALCPTGTHCYTAMSPDICLAVTPID